MTPELRRVLALAKRRGAKFAIVDDAAWEATRNGRGRSRRWYESPSTHLDLAIDGRTQTVMISASITNDVGAAGNVIHEFGHIHASRRSVENSDEWAWLGWEFAVAREARAVRAWDAAMSGYTMGAIKSHPEIDGYDWHALTRGEQLVVKRNRFEHARDLNLIDGAGRAHWGRPTSWSRL